MDRGDKILAWILSILLLAIAFVVLVTSVPEGSGLEAHVRYSEIYRNYALIVGGAIGFVFAWWRLRLTDQQTKTAERDSKQKELDHVAARFERAVELLGSDEIRFQQFAISSIDRIAKGWPDEYAAAAISLIAGQLRIIASASRKRRDPEGFPTNFVNETAMYLFEQIADCELGRIYYPEVELTDVVLERPQIRNLIVTPQTFKGSELQQADFLDCSFEGDFEAGDFQCVGAVFTNCEFDHTSFRNIDFAQTAFFDCDVRMATWMDCDMRCVAFRDVKFLKKRPVFYRCVMDDVDFCVSVSFNKPLGGPNLTSTNFEECRVLNYNRLPTGLDEYEPPLIAVLTGERDENGHQFEVMGIEEADHAVVAQAE